MTPPAKPTLKTRLNAAAAASTVGDAAGAAAIYRQILAQYPKHLGAKKALKKLGKTPEPASGGVPADQAGRLLSLVNGGQLAAAEKLARQLSRSHPGEAGLFNIIGFCQTRSGDNESALASFRSAVQINPALVEALSNLGSLLIQLERPEEAVTPLQQAIHNRPDYAEAHHNLGLAYAALQDIELAETALGRAIELVPDYLNARNSRAMLYARTGKYQPALDDYAAIVALRPGDADAQFNAADMLAKLGRADAALAGFVRARNLRPGHSNTLRRIIVLLITTGQTDQAKSALEALLTLDPDDCAAMRALAQYWQMQAGDPLIARMKALFKAPNASETDRINLGFGLGKALDDLGENHQSFAWYKRANDLNYARLPAEADEKYARIETCKRVFTREFVTRFDSVEPVTPSPIFIVGMPRSGTTLVEQILASHSTVHGAGELDAAERFSAPLYLDLEALSLEAIDEFSKAYVSVLKQNAADNACVTDKTPTNFHHIGLLKLAFPQAKFINLVRDPRDVGLSLYRQYFDNIGHRYAYNLDALAKFANSYKALMGFWHDLFPGRIYDVVYENLTADQEAETRKLLEYCGLDWQDRVLDFHKTKRSVKTASLTQVRQKMYRSSVRKWQAYAGQLAPLIDGIDRGLWADYLGGD